MGKSITQPMVPFPGIRGRLGDPAISEQYHANVKTVSKLITVITEGQLLTVAVLLHGKILNRLTLE